MKPTNTVAKLFSSVSTLAVVACAMAFNSVAWGQVGAVLAWGSDGDGQCKIPVEANSRVSAIAGGCSHTIALKNGEVLAWGANGDGQITIPAAAKSGVTAIAGGESHTIALKNGRVYAWGLNSSGQNDIPPVTTWAVSAIACGSFHSIALKEKYVYAWGARSQGQCNTLPAAESDVVLAIAGGCSHTIVLIDAPSCLSDIDGSGMVDAGDVSLVLLDVGLCNGCPADLDGSGMIDSGDVSMVLLDYGPCPN